MKKENANMKNYYKDIFPYEEIPKLKITGSNIVTNRPKNLYITDTTFRDGQQARSPYKVEEVVDLFTLLHRLDNGSGIIKQSEFFLYSDNNIKAVKECQQLGFRYPEITSWIRANKEDFKLVKKYGLKETGILVSCSDYHIYNKLGLTRKKAMKKYLDIVVASLEEGIIPRCHLEDITRADFDGFVAPFIDNLLNLMMKYDMPIKIRACDTLGLGSSVYGVPLPRGVAEIINRINRVLGVPSELIEWHGHNDYYNAVPNAVSAWLYGASAVNTSLLGIGERTGNTPLEAMCIEYCQLTGDMKSLDLKVITEIACYFEKKLKYQIPPRTPYVGRAFNATRAGIHIDGLLKDEKIYNSFNTTKILGRAPIVLVDATSGTSGISAWINSYFNLEGDDRIDKEHVCVKKIKEWVDLQYKKGRDTVIGDLELENEVHKYLPELLKMNESRSE